MSESKFSLDPNTCQALLEMAHHARLEAYAPYSSYLVGAALLCPNGRIFTACNVESVAFGAGCCAERAALFQAIAQGERHFTAIAVVAAPEPSANGALLHTSPCGVCRQQFLEFCQEDFIFILADKLGDYSAYHLLTLGEVLPHAFAPQALEAGL